MIGLADARRIVLDACSPLDVVPCPLASALGCVTASPVVADAPVPAFANSSMDGFALVAADTLEAPVVLNVVATTLAGMAPASLGGGEAVRIMTGAPLPSGADAVCMIERTMPGPGAGEVTIESVVRRGEFVRHPGDDLVAGQVVVDAGTHLGPAHLGVLAAIGVERVEVIRRPRVGVLSTGDELVAAGSPLAPGQIRDANRPSLLALVERAGCEAVDLGVAPDDEEAITEAVTLGSERCDAVVVSGGVSVGDADLVKVVLGRLCEGTMHWMQIAIKPAKPFAFGVATASATPIFGVPGNPGSAMVSFELLVRPALNQLAGRPAFGAPQLSAVADEPLERVRDGKTHFLRVIAEAGADGRIHVRSSGVQASHVLSAMAAANALAEVPDGTGIGAGEQVDILLLEADALAAASRRTAAVARR